MSSMMCTSYKRIKCFTLVATCFLIQMLSAGNALTFGVLYRQLRQEFNTSQYEAAWIASIFNGLLGFVGVPLSFIVNRVGERWPTLSGVVLLSLGLITSMFAMQTSTFYITYGLIAGTGAGILHYCGYTVHAAHFSKKWRPVAITISSAGIPLASLFVPPSITVLLETFDWRKAFMFLACFSSLGVPAVYFFFPSTSTISSTSVTGNKSQQKRKKSKFLKDVNFVLYFLSTCILYLVVYVPVTFLPDLMYEFGRTSQDVYVCLITMGSCDLISRLLSGILVLKNPSYVAFIHGGGIALFGASSGLITLSKSLEMFVIMSGLIGLGIGCFASLFFVMCTHVLPEEDVRTGFGMVITLGGFALIGGMPLAGYLSDYYETERGAFIFSSILLCTSACLELSIGIRDLCCTRQGKNCPIKTNEQSKTSSFIKDNQFKTEHENVVIVEESTYM